MKLVQEAEKQLRVEQMSRFCDYLRDKGGRPASILPQLQRQLLDICADADLCATAVMMEKRPPWVQMIIGDRIGR